MTTCTARWKDEDGTVRVVGCRKTISPNDVKKSQQVFIEDENGKKRVSGVMHNKCWWVASKAARSGLGRVETPTAYEVAAAHRNASDLTEEALARKAKAEQRYAEAQAKLAALREQDELREQAGVLSSDMSLADALAEAEREEREAGEVLNLAEHQAQLSQQRALEDNRSEFRDWREPTEMDV